MKRKTREEDSTFELNLAPMLDIIVSIVPMLLLSVVFVQIAVVDTPVPQAVKKAMEQAEKNPNDVQITVAVTNDQGFKIQVVAAGHTKETLVGLKNNELDYDSLHKEVVTLKQQYPDVFRMELHPDETVSLEKIISSMDQMRTRSKTDPQIYFTDVDSGKKVETELLFPDVVFGNVAGG